MAGCRRTWTDEDLILAVPQSFSMADVMRLIGIVPRGGNYKTVRECITRLELDTSHFTNKGWNVGPRYRKVVEPRPLAEILVKSSTFTSSKLRLRLISEGVKKHRCENCKLTVWQGLPIPLELDHVNGINTDNRLENLRLLCPNCHAQTDNYRGKNKGKYGGVSQRQRNGS